MHLFFFAETFRSFIRWDMLVTETFWSFAGLSMGQIYLSHSHPIAICACPVPSHGTFPMGFPFPWTSLVICLTAVLKLARIVFFSLYFQTFWPKWLNLFPSFQKRFGPWPKKKTQLCTIGWPQCTIGWPLVWCETDLQFDAWPHGDTFQLL